MEPGHSTRAGGFLGGMRVRKKVLILHTLFSLGLAAVLLVPLRPAITEVVEQAEANEARAVLRLVLARVASGAPSTDWMQLVPEGRVRSGTPEELGIAESVAAQARIAPGRPQASYV